MNLDHVIILISCALTIVFAFLWLRGIAKRKEITCELNHRGEAIFDEEEINEVLSCAQYNSDKTKVIVTIVKP